MLSGVRVDEEENLTGVGLDESGVQPLLPVSLWGRCVSGVFQPCRPANAVWPGPHLEKAPLADAEQEEVQEPHCPLGLGREDSPAEGSRAVRGPLSPSLLRRVLLAFEKCSSHLVQNGQNKQEADYPASSPVSAT